MSDCEQSYSPEYRSDILIENENYDYTLYSTPEYRADILIENEIDDIIDYLVTSLKTLQLDIK